MAKNSMQNTHQLIEKVMMMMIVHLTYNRYQSLRHLHKYRKSIEKINANNRQRENSTQFWKCNTFLYLIFSVLIDVRLTFLFDFFISLELQLFCYLFLFLSHSRAIQSKLSQSTQHTHTHSPFQLMMFHCRCPCHAFLHHSHLRISRELIFFNQCSLFFLIFRDRILRCEWAANRLTIIQPISCRFFFFSSSISSTYFPNMRKQPVYQMYGNFQIL